MPIEMPYIMDLYQVIYENLKQNRSVIFGRSFCEFYENIVQKGIQTDKIWTAFSNPRRETYSCVLDANYELTIMFHRKGCVLDITVEGTDWAKNFYSKEIQALVESVNEFNCSKAA